MQQGLRFRAGGPQAAAESREMNSLQYPLPNQIGVSHSLGLGDLLDRRKVAFQEGVLTANPASHGAGAIPFRHADKLLVPGGRLLYVTCSVFAAENEDVVARFLQDTADAKEERVLQNNNIRDLMRDKACGRQILPGTAGMDGFYYAGLVKVS